MAAQNEKYRDIFAAADHGDIAAVNRFVDEGVPVDCVDDAEQTPLMRAVIRGHAPLAAWLIERGASIDLKDYMGDSALGHSLRGDDSVAAGDERCARLLIEAGAALNDQNRFHLTPLMIAAKRMSANFIEFMIDKGANIHIETPKPTNMSALYLAARYDNIPAAECLVRRGAIITEHIENHFPNIYSRLKSLSETLALRRAVPDDRNDARLGL